MAMEEREERVPQFGTHPVEPKIEQHFWKSRDLAANYGNEILSKLESITCWQEHSGCLLYDSCQKVAKLGKCTYTAVTAHCVHAHCTVCMYIVQVQCAYMHIFDIRSDGGCGSADAGACDSS